MTSFILLFCLISVVAALSAYVTVRVLTVLARHQDALKQVLEATTSLTLNSKETEAHVALLAKKQRAASATTPPVTAATPVAETPAP